MPRFTSQSWFLTGPTACGKSSLALELAEMLGAEIVSLDSMTLYRQLDIGTAKPTIADRSRVPHHLVDILDPWETSSLDHYLRQADQACQEILARGNRPLFVGGTPLYLKACLRGIFDGPPASPEQRDHLERLAAENGAASLHEQLQSIDPRAASRISPSDVRRIVRALEVFQSTGKPISEWQKQFDHPASPRPAVACLLPDRASRHASIDKRVLSMIDAGWIDEVKRLLLPGVPSLSKTARQAVGYQEIIDHLEGKLDLARAIELIQTRTRQFSKRQMTWFRHLEEIRWFETSATGPTPSLRDEIAGFFRHHDSTVADPASKPTQ
jgi:tRNA dimethylallyltransferase